jgi:ribosomal protein S12 methylthiotransferase
VTGCLAQRYADDLVRALPEVDAFVGTGELTRIAAAVEAGGGRRSGRAPEQSSTGSRVYRGAHHELPPYRVSPRIRTGAWWTAYLKVSEGCDHRCSFCIIPTIRGRHESRTMADLLAEAESLVGEGTVELNLIAQDLTAYGRDLGDGTTLARLLRALAVRVPQARWLRLLYAYPASVTDELLEVIATEPAVCKYLDMPLQHVADDMLRAMRRERSGAAIRRLVRRIRDAVPGIALRSSFIVGFPGETDAHVDELCAFLEEVALDRVGVFRYSQEEGTPAAGLPDQVPDAVKRRRWERVMRTQARVASRCARTQIGREIEALVEGDGRRPGTLVGRSRDQAPEIDGVIELRGDAAPGDLVLAKITETGTYDLRGEVVAADAVDTVAARF